MLLADLVEAAPQVSLLDPQANHGLPITDIVIDSRRASAGHLFVALKGARRDGHDFLEEIAAQGATAALVAADRVDQIRRRLPTLPLLSAPEPRAALGLLADRFFGEPSRALTVLGITGTNGKTTCSALLASILEARGLRVGVVGTIGYRWPGHQEKAANTTPESLTLHRMMARMLEAGVDAVVMEVSSHGLATHRLVGVRFDGALFTNLSQDHLDFHGTMQAYLQAKASLFEELLPWSAQQGKGRPVAALNLDDDQVRPLLDRLQSAPLQIVGFSARPDEDRAEVRPVGRPRLGLAGLEARLRLPGEEEPLDVVAPLVGSFNMENVLGSAALAEAVEAVTPRDLAAGLAGLSPVPGRLQRVEVPEGGEGRGGPAVFVDYAHTPDALRRALEALREHVPSGGQLVVVFGCGGERDRGKRPQMGAAGWAGADRLVLTSDNPRGEAPEAILEDILGGIPQDVEQGPPGEGRLGVEPDREQAIRRAVLSAGASDVILVAGKGHEDYQEIGGERKHFDDVEVARATLEDRAKEARKDDEQR